MTLLPTLAKFSAKQQFIIPVFKKCYSNSSSEKTFLVLESSGVRTMIMNSPKTRNALSFELMTGLLNNIENSNDGQVRCIVIRANGPVFSSGHNLKQLAAEDTQRHNETFALCGKLCLAIQSAPVPVLAAVDGIAAAAGCQLAAACDLVIATRRSKFSTPGANFGLFCSGPGVTIGRSVGRKHAAHMLLTGLPVTAEHALAIGLISQVCPDDKLDETVNTTVEAITSKSRSVIKLGKKFFNQQLNMNTETAYTEAAKVMADNLKTSDGQEGLKSFVEKRTPIWGV